MTSRYEISLKNVTKFGASNHNELCKILKRNSLDNKHEPILNPMATPFAVEQELLDSTTKKELVLAASEDLETFANQLKQIKALDHVLESSDIAGWW
jgi:hypothetical protein